MQAVVDVLETAEQQWCETSSEWKRKIKQFELWKSMTKERERQADRLKKAKNDDEPAADQDTNWEVAFNPEDPSPQFSFAGNPPVFSKSDLEDEIWSLVRWKAAPDWALKALRRGVGVHHSGMNKHYRFVIEA